MADEAPRIHPTAVISPGARLHDSVVVGPFAVIEDDVEIGAGCTIGPHCVIRRWVRLGTGNTLAAHVVLGEPPQHAKYDGSETWLIIGDDNVIREGATFHRAYEKGAATRIGSRCFLMGYTHVAHDCVIGDGVTMTNYVGLAGHAELGDGVVLGGAAVVHQFVRIGERAMVAGQVGVRKDVLPFTLVGGHPVRHYRLNAVGLRRNGVTGERYRALEQACRALREGRALPEGPDTPELQTLRRFIAAPSRRGITGWTRGKATAED
jgi:UDP-N-acetylglucosamine acyltransferase